MKLTPRKLKWLLNCYPPYIGAGVKIVSISDDWRSLGVRMKLRWYNRNWVGTHFGGSLYSMVDPHLMLMLLNILGRDYIVWDKSAHIEYVQASRCMVFAHIAISDAQIQAIKQHTDDGEKYLPEFKIELKDAQQNLVATINKVIYIRRKMPVKESS